MGGAPSIKFTAPCCICFVSYAKDISQADPHLSTLTLGSIPITGQVETLAFYSEDRNLNLGSIPITGQVETLAFYSEDRNLNLGSIPITEQVETLSILRTEP